MLCARWMASSLVGNLKRGQSRGVGVARVGPEPVKEVVTTHEQFTWLPGCLIGAYSHQQRLLWPIPSQSWPIVTPTLYWPLSHRHQSEVNFVSGEVVRVGTCLPPHLSGSTDCMWGFYTAPTKLLAAVNCDHQMVLFGFLSTLGGIVRHCMLRTG